MSPPRSRGPAAAFLAVVRSGAGAVALHPLRSATTAGCVAAIVLPWCVGQGISGGLRDEIEDAVRLGPDVHVTGTRFGRPAPIPAAAALRLRAVPGVTEVVPRVVGELRVGVRDEGAVVVGVPAGSVPGSLRVVEGRLFADGAPGEVVLGSEVAARLGAKSGDVLPPMHRNEAGERTLRVVGVFRSDGPLWQSHAILASLETAGSLFAERDAVTEFLVRCPANYREPVAAKIRAMESLGPAGAVPPIRPRASTRDDVEALLLRRALDRETLFQLPLVLAFALGVPLVLVASGVGLVERRREAGILRAVGWSQDALLLRALAESLLLALLGAAVAVLLSFAWLRLLDGAGIAPVLLPGADRVPAFRVPWRLAPETALVALAVSVAIVAAGTLPSTWRFATTPPAEAMR